jgi:hypothetical protein
VVDKIVDKTILSANFTASAISGGVGGLGAYARSIPGAALKTTGAFYSNLWKAETIGPNLKVIGSVVAAPVLVAGALVGLPVSLCTGLYRGAEQIDSSKPREFTIGAANHEGYGKTVSGWQRFTKSTTEGLAEMGNQKLGQGEKPFDIPLMKTAKTLAIGAAGVAVGGVAGVISAVVGTVRNAATGIAKAATDENLNVAGKVIAGVGAVLGGTIQGVSYGLASGVSILGNGIGKTWSDDSFFEGGKQIFTQAGKAIAASAAPRQVLLEERTED